MCTYPLSDGNTVSTKADSHTTAAIYELTMMHLGVFLLTTTSVMVQSMYMNNHYAIILNLISVCWYQISIIRTVIMFEAQR